MSATTSTRSIATRLPLRLPASPAISLGVAALGFAAAALVALDVTGGLRGTVVAIALAIVPGFPIVRLLGLRDRIARAVLTIVASVAVEAVFALGMVWMRLWDPMPVATGILLIGAWVALATAVQATRTQPLFARPASSAVDSVDLSVRVRSLALFGALVAGIACWVVGIRTTDVTNLGEWGLIDRLPVVWYIGTAVILGVTLASIIDRRVFAAVRGIAATSLVFLMYATTNLAESTPRPPWVFKHIAVVDYIIQHGSVNPSIDIYNRWPGFFSAAAFIGEAAGHADPMSYVRWAEMGFAIVDGALVLAIARTLGVRGRWAWAVALVFSAGNWVGQNYFSPQAFAFVLFLASVLLALTFLRGRPNAVGRWFERIVSRLFRAKVDTVDAPVQTVPRAAVVTAVTLILLFQAVITVSHQLTPYALVSAFVPLLILGYLRPWWLSVPLVAMPIGFLIPNLDYIEKQFGLSTGFNLVGNIVQPPGSDIIPTAASELQAKGVLALTAVIALVALFGLIRRVRAGHVRRALMTLWLAASPIVILFGQSYGGEGKYRVVLFATPFLAVGVAWLFHGRLRRAIGLAGTILVVVALWFAATLQAETSNQVPENHIAAAQWLETQFGPNDTVFTAAQSFPFLIGPEYPNYLHHWSQQADWTSEAPWYHGKMTVADLEQSMKTLDYGGHEWFAFSALDSRAAIGSGALTAKELDTLQHWVETHTTLRYDHDGVRIYEATNGR